MREMFEGDSADTCAGKFPLVSMGASGILPLISLSLLTTVAKLA